MKSGNLLPAAVAAIALCLYAPSSLARTVDTGSTEGGVADAGGLTAAPAKAANKPGQAKFAAVPAARPATVTAQSAAERSEIEVLRNQIKELAEQIKDLKQSGAAATKTVTQLQAATEDALARKVDGKGNMFTYANGRPTLATTDGNFSMAFRVRVQLDGGKYFQDAGLGAIPVTATTAPITGPAGRLASGVFFRRMFFGAEGRFLKDWEYEIRMNGGSTGTEQAMALDNVRLGYRGLDYFLFEIGAWDIPFTMDQALQAPDSFFMERSSAQTLAAGLVAGLARKAVGFRYFRDVNKNEPARTEDSIFAMAMLTGDLIANPNAVNAFTNVTNSATGVVTAVPNPAADSTLAAGVTQSVNALARVGYRLVPDPNTAITIEGDYAKVISPKSFVSTTLPGSAVKGPLITFGERPEFRGDTTSLVTTGPIPAKSAEIWSIQATAQRENVLVDGAYYHYSMARDEFVLPVNQALAGSSADPEFEGYDITGSWIITGERRGFNKENFGILGVIPKSPFSLKGGTGAFEAVARYSVLDLNYNAGSAGVAAVPGVARNVGGNGLQAAQTVLAPTPTDGRIRGGRQQITSLGLNWYPNSNVRFTTQYELVSVDKLNNAGQQQGQDLNILAARMQFGF